jgi:hypothetical protein
MNSWYLSRCGHANTFAPGNRLGKNSCKRRCRVMGCGRPNGWRQPPPSESHSVDRDAVWHSTPWKIASTGRSAARVVSQPCNQAAQPAMANNLHKQATLEQGMHSQPSRPCTYVVTVGSSPVANTARGSYYRHPLASSRDRPQTEP